MTSRILQTRGHGFIEAFITVDNKIYHLTQIVKPNGMIITEFDYESKPVLFTKSKDATSFTKETVSQKLIDFDLEKTFVGVVK